MSSCSLCLKQLVFSHYPILRLGFAGAFCYEALRVPPLLPEYLSQPVQVVIHSAGSGWWEPIIAIASPFIGLLGVAIGAAIARSQQRKQRKLEKLEEIAYRTRSLYLDVSHFIDSLHQAARSIEGDAEDARVFVDQSKLLKTDSMRAQMDSLKFLLDVHCPEVKDEFKELTRAIVSLLTGVQLDVIGYFDDADAFQEFYSSVLKDREIIKIRHIELQQAATMISRKFT